MHLLILVLIYTLPTAQTACSIYIQSSNIKYLDSTQLQRWNISDQCTTTCTDGFYGDFCQDLSKYTNLPIGPWNQAGYCTAGSSLRSMSINVGSFSYIQYTKKESILVGMANPGTTTLAGDGTSVVSEISLYSGTITPVLYPTPAGSLNSLLVRKGVVYVSRTVQVMEADTFDIAVLVAPMQAQKLMSTNVMASMFEVCTDKGTVTAFVYGSSSIRACYPSGTCDTWLPSINVVIGMVVGADCQKALYVSSLENVLKVTSTGAVTLRTADSNIYCMTGIPDINLLLYKTKNSVWQVNLGTGAAQSLPLGVIQTQEVQCSLDISENSNQVLIAQNGVISTLEAVQEPCPYGKTSTALICNSTSQCTACPPPPSNAYNVDGSVSCEWVCRAGFELVGSKCVGQVELPCPNFYKVSTATAGVCVPSVLPWAAQGKYAQLLEYSPQKLLPVENSAVYLLASEGQALIHAVPGQFYLSMNGGGSWTPLSFAELRAASCYTSNQNSYYYLSAKGGMLYTAFTQQRLEGTQHCLWEVSATEAIASNGAQNLRVTRSWALDRQLCSATGNGDEVFGIFCAFNYVSYTRGGQGLAPYIGSPVPGYVDGVFDAVRLRAPSSLVAHDSRLYIADTGNCVIREVDLVRGVVLTVAGTAGTCQRVDGGRGAMLTYPSILSYTAYDGFFLFVDKNLDGQSSYVRQFHAKTSTVSTVQGSPFIFSQISGLAASQYGVMVMAQRFYYTFGAVQRNCPPGTSSLAGNAFDANGCFACPASHYSDTVSGTCKPCSSPACNLPGQLLVPCQLDSDAFCGTCTNKPGNSQYTAASSIPGTSSGGGDCPWAYNTPCPVGYYGSVGLCSACPLWSTTPSAGSTSLADCVCVGNGRRVGVACVIPSPFATMPGICSPLSNCGAYVPPTSLFPILPGCTAFDVDSPTGVCPCQPGEYIQQIYPKVCTACPAGLYSPDGKGCRACPYLTEPSLDKASCRCTVGTTDIALAQTTPQCVCGPGRAFSAMLGCTLCPANSYNNQVRGYTTTGGMACSPCLSGTWSEAGATECVDCPVGQYLVWPSDKTCQSCSPGSYAPYPTISLCVDCVADCGGQRETQCPTDSALYMCSECPPPRANAVSNGGRDCATSCLPGFYELDGECVPCSQYYKATCPEGNRLVECSSYADAGCVGCVNSSMPLNYAKWTYSASVPDGPSLVCEWECETGYSPQHAPLPEGVAYAWECVKAGEWSVWDLFTV